MSSFVLNEHEIKRYDGQLNFAEIGNAGQIKLKNSKIVVIGAGGLGIPIIQYLSASGVGTICIIDYAVINYDNIQNQTLYSVSDFGKLKTIVAKNNFEKVFNLVSYEIFNIKVNNENCESLLKNYDFVVDATNNDYIHCIVDKVCNKMKITYITGILSGMIGYISVFNYLQGIDYNDFNKWLTNKLNNSKPGFAYATYGIMGTFMAMESIRGIINLNKSLFGKVLILDFEQYKFFVTQFKSEFVNNL